MLNSISQYWVLWLVVFINTPAIVASQEVSAIRREGRTNTQCVNATIIPSRVTTTNPYVDNTTRFDGRNAQSAIDRAPPNITCPQTDYSKYVPDLFQVRSAWYRWVPETSGYYDLKASIAELRPFWFSIMKGSSCSNLRVPIGCRLTSARGVYLDAGTSYYITMFVIQQYGSNLDLIISPTIFRPINDDCQNAITIPTSVKLPYNITTATNVFSNATIQPNERIASCDRFVVYGGTVETTETNYGALMSKNNFGGHSIWYTYSPSTTGYYNFQTLGTLSNSFPSDVVDAPITIAVYEVNENASNRSGMSICTNMTNHFTEKFCSRRPGRFYRNIDRISELKAGKQYYIQLVPDMYDREVITNLTFTISRIPAPVANDLCTSATVIDPIVGIQNVSINTNYATTDALYHPDGINCTDYAIPANLLQNGVWYKYIHLGGNIELVHNLCQRFRGLTYYLFRGESCDSLRCVEFLSTSSCSSGVTYVIDEPTTYWFFLSPTGLANFTVSFNRPNHFRLINAENDTVFGLLNANKSYSYSLFAGRTQKLPTTKLNIDAYFQPEFNVRSTRITYSNPNMSRCENTVPYSAFGDTNGNYHPRALTLGTHVVRAIPYAQPECQGPAIAGATINSTFTVEGCNQGWNFYINALGDKYSFSRLSNVPCAVVMGGDIECGFTVQNISVELKYSNTSIVVDTVMNSLDSYQKTYYFGILNASSVLGVSPMTLHPGETYTITLTIDNIRHVSLTPFSTQAVCTP